MTDCRMRSAAGTVLISILIAGSITFAGIILYSIINDSGHTSADPYITLAVFLPVTAAGAAAAAFRDKWKLPLWLCITTIAVGCAGILLLIYLDRSNSLLQYEVWLNRGMP